MPQERRKPSGYITIRGARENNLKNIDVQIPLGIMTCVTGVSGSGKSSLTNEILYKHLAKSLNRARCIAGDHDGIDGLEQLDKVIDIDQSPIGRTPRSNPATYTGVFDMIRDLFASTPDAKAKGYKKGRFSFNVKSTTGLHFADVHKLVEILRRLSDGGNTVVVIEHNLDVIKTADYIIDMGPEGGDGGGTVIAQGTPEEICEVKQSYTGRFLKQYLEKDKVKL